MPYRRVVLKLSGEMLCKPGICGIAPDEVLPIAKQLVAARELGTGMAVVVGAGNLFRGRDLEQLGFDRVSADQMGMVSTVVNALAFEAVLRHESVPVKVLSAVRVEGFVEPYTVRAAREALDRGSLVLLAGGTGNPYFTTDTAAALRAAELNAEVLLKATKVDGVYSADPNACQGAKKYDRISYEAVLEKRLGFMDAAAVAICRDVGIPIVVFSLNPPSNVVRAVRGEKVGTIVGRTENGH